MFVLETSYEIVHKVGGVETVVRSKAPEMIKTYGANFLMCGPFIPSDDRYQTMFEDLRSQNQPMNELLSNFEQDFQLPPQFVKYGQWLCAGCPKCVLLPVDIPQGYMQAVRAKAVDTLNKLLNLDLNNMHEQGE